MPETQPEVEQGNLQACTCSCTPHIGRKRASIFPRGWKREPLQRNCSPISADALLVHCDPMWATERARLWHVHGKWQSRVKNGHRITEKTRMQLIPWESKMSTACIIQYTECHNTVIWIYVNPRPPAQPFAHVLALWFTSLMKSRLNVGASSVKRWPVLSVTPRGSGMSVSNGWNRIESSSLPSSSSLNAFLDVGGGASSDGVADGAGGVLGVGFGVGVEVRVGVDEDDDIFFWFKSTIVILLTSQRHLIHLSSTSRFPCE